MRVLVLYAHPVETSFSAALHKATVEALTAAGYEVDDCDLYAEKFDPVMSRQEGLDYHDETACTKPVETYVARLRQAEALVICAPIWNYGYPAILKGFFDRVFLPGVSFRLIDGKVWPSLQHIRKIAAVHTYGGSRFRTFLMGNAPRKAFTRTLRALVYPFARTRYLALYNMNKAGAGKREAFLARVSVTMRAF